MWGMGLIEQWVKRGIPTQEIGYLAFTKAAAVEATTRVSDGRFNADDYPNFRTIHSLCFRLMREGGVEKRVVMPGDMKKFAKESGLEGEYAIQAGEDLAEAYQSLQIDAKSIWDNCRTAYMLSRISSRSVDDLDRAKTEISREAIRRMGWGDTDAYVTFVQKYEAFKESNGLVDFTDMLEYPLRNRCAVDCRKVIVDEGQDLCALHFKIVERLFDDEAEEVWHIGDDDQAIFGFSGASAEEFLSQIGGCKKVVLRQTHRFGQEIVDFSERIIRRVANRIEKDVIGKPDSPCAVSVSGEFAPTHDDGFILHRHVRGCQQLGARFINAGIPFTNERGRSPLSSANRIKAFEAMNELADGKKIKMGGVVLLVEDLMPSFWVSDDETQKIRLVVHGAKKKLAEASGMTDVTLDDLVSIKIVTKDGAAVVKERKYEVLKHEPDLRYYEKLRKSGYRLAPGGPTITTIHGSKGREKNRVTVFAESGRKCWQDPDNEHRLAYVAATRTKEYLTICHEQTLDWATVPYDYPIEVAV